MKKSLLLFTVCILSFATFFFLKSNNLPFHSVEESISNALLGNERVLTLIRLQKNSALNTESCNLQEIFTQSLLKRTKRRGVVVSVSDGLVQMNNDRANLLRVDLRTQQIDKNQVNDDRMGEALLIDIAAAITKGSQTLTELKKTLVITARNGFTVCQNIEHAANMAANQVAVWLSTLPEENFSRR